MCDGIAHLYSRLKNLAHGVQNVGHLWSSALCVGVKTLHKIVMKRSGFAFRFRQRPYWSRLPAGVTHG